jgi:hypothetical protein
MNTSDITNKFTRECYICKTVFDLSMYSCPQCHTFYEYDEGDSPSLPDNLKQAIAQMIQDPEYQRIFNLKPPQDIR